MALFWEEFLSFESDKRIISTLENDSNEERRIQCCMGKQITHN